MRPWAGGRGPSTAPLPRKPKRIPNPIKCLRVLSRKDVAVSIMPGSLLYTVYSCIHTSLSTITTQTYHLQEWQVGLVYLPFGIGAIISTLVSSHWIDREYRVVAKAHGLSIDEVSGDDLLHFPIEEARTRGAFVPTFCAFASVLTYGWLVQHHVVSACDLPSRLVEGSRADQFQHLAAPLGCLFVAGFSIQTCFNVSQAPGRFVGSVSPADETEINNTLLVDINPDVPATAQASSNVVRCIFSATFVAVLQQIIDGIGFGWAFTIMSSLCLMAGGFYFVELRYGQRWRLARHGMTID